jgi:predicted TIM-barrel fold metal-dependent hydrolase
MVLISSTTTSLSTGMPSETATAVMSLLMGGILEQFPALKICFAHGGGSFPYTIGRMQHGFLVRPDLCAQVYIVSNESSHTTNTDILRTELICWKKIVIAH